MDRNEPDWLAARRGINLLLNDKNKEAEDLFNNSPPNIHMTAGICYVTFMNALMCFDDKKVTEAIVEIKKIEMQCITQIGWMKSIKNKIFISQDDEKSLEQSLEERIVLADSLVCQSFLTFLRNDFTSYMKGGWTLRRAWKIYQHTYEQLCMLNNKYKVSSNNGWKSPNSSNSPTTLSNSSWSLSENDQLSHANNSSTIKQMNNQTSKYCKTDNQIKDADFSKNPDNNHLCRHFYSCTSKTFSDFSTAKAGCKIEDCELKCFETRYFEKGDIEAESGCQRSKSSSTCSLSVQASKNVRPNSLQTTKNGSKESLNTHSQSSIRKSVSLFSSINSFSSAIYESATSLIGLKKECADDWERIDPDAILRLMSAVCFGYGIFKLCVSLAPPSILRWANMLGFEGDQTTAIESLNYSRKGSDMRAPLASLALLWYHTIVRPFFNLDGVIVASGVEEASKILIEEIEFENSALFLFFKGRVERLKPNISGAIEAYQLSVTNATLTDVKLLGLHEVGWCHLLTLDYQKAYTCFLQLRHQSKWSRSFYAYLTTINAGAYGNVKSVLPGKNEIRNLLEKSHNKGAQIEKYINRRMQNLPEEEDQDAEWVKDKIHWQLYCFEMLYLWNTFPSCQSEDLIDIVKTCTPLDGEESLPHEPMKGIGWLIKGAASLVLANRMNKKSIRENGATNGENITAFLTKAVEAFRMCLNLRSNCTDDVHISAFAQYELALLLLRDENTRPEGKLLLIRSQSQYKDFDFEHRLNVRINSTLKNLEKYESDRK